MPSSVANYDNPAALGRTYPCLLLGLILTILVVAIWPHTFTPLGTALAALVTQVFLGHRQVTDALLTRSALNSSTIGYGF